AARQLRVAAHHLQLPSRQPRAVRLEIFHLRRVRRTKPVDGKRSHRTHARATIEERLPELSNAVADRRHNPHARHDNAPRHHSVRLQSANVLSVRPTLTRRFLKRCRSRRVSFAPSTSTLIGSFSSRSIQTTARRASSIPSTPRPDKASN